MAIQKETQVSFTVVGDGTSTSFTLDLLADPYSVSTSGSLAVMNWFSTDRKASSPTGIGSVQYQGGGGINPTATLSGTIVTVTFLTPPTNGTVFFGLLF